MSSHGSGSFGLTASPAGILSGRDETAHQALVYATHREFAAAAVPHLREGLLGGDAVVAIVGPGAERLLRQQLGADAARSVEFVEASAWFTGPMSTLAAYHDRTRRDWWPRGRLRLLAEPVWNGRTPLEVCEWKRHEALLNVAFAGTPTLLMCAYDAAALPAHVLTDAARTHPEVVNDRGPRPSGQYVDPAVFYAECNARPLAAPPKRAAWKAFAGGKLPALREFLAAEAARLGLPADRSLPFVLAVNEVATTVVRQGGGRGLLWVWAQDGELLCDVGDPEGRMEDRFLGCFPPHHHKPGEAAMWAVRRLCHIVEIRSGPGGTRVRMHLKLDDEPRDEPVREGDAGPGDAPVGPAGRAG
ncbi:anti-sigma factor RsbA family regulatory protein [Actinomadura sp. 9N407]|uniref:anti-sigma factor RsbA family regulatory protein n=1 Tax=Actinomadura sp. 9N407 TaxID=3375154 RepID=UPI0037A74AC9